LNSRFEHKGKLELHTLIRALIEDGRVDGDAARDAARDAEIELRSPSKTRQHPLTLIASYELEDITRPGKKMTSTALAEWLSQQGGLPMCHIDPPKSDAHSITEVMSF